MTEKNVISNYKYIKTIGEGTFGKVKLAIHIITGEKVAIKILQKNLIKDQNEYDRIEREIKYLKLFSHPNIIQIYEVIENISSFYIVMEYAPGGELFNYIVEKEKLSEKESSFYFYQIIQGIKEIHSKKICHRDIKPENLLFTKNKILKIIDFGLSSEYDNFLSTPCGSPCYASPEMIRGKKYNGLSIDLWACGVILFAMLCGYLPFDDKNNNILFRKIVECNIDYPEEDEVELSENSLDLINKILTPNPKKRIGLEEILEHPFMKYGKKVYNNIINKPDNFTQEELIINYMINELGFNNNNNTIEKYIHSNRHNNITTTYYLLKQKFLDGRLNCNIKTMVKQISDQDCSNILLNNKNSSNNISNNSLSFNNNNNSNSNYINYSKKKIQYIKNKFNYDDKEKQNNITYNNFNYKKRSKTSSCSQSKKNILSIKNMIKKKDLMDRNNIIIINNTNMIQQPQKIKSIYNNLFFKSGNMQNNFYRKIETSISLEKSINKNNNLTSIVENSKLGDTYNKNNNKKNNVKEQIKVCLKKDEKNDNPILYFKKFKENELLIKKKFIYLPSHNFSNKSKNRKTQTRSYQNDFLAYKKNSTGMGGFNNNYSNIYSFDGNTSNNFNTSLTNNYLNALSYDTNNFTFNFTKNSEIGHISTSRDKKNNIKNIFMNDDFNNKYKNKILNKNNDQNLSNTIEIINKENSEILNKSAVKAKNVLDKNKINYVKNIEKICRRIFRQNNKKYINYLNTKKSYDNKSKERKFNDNYKNKHNQKSNRELLNMNNIRKEYLFPSTNKAQKINKSINNININSLSNKIIVKNILTKNSNNNNTSNINKKSNQSQTQATIESNFNKLKNLMKNNNNANITNNFYRKINCESFNDKNNKVNKKINTLKNLSPNENNKNNLRNNINVNNISNVSNMNKKNKINKNIKEILSLKSRLKKNKERLENKTSIYNILQNEKENIQIELSTRNNFKNSNRNYMPITTRDKRLYVSRNQNFEFNNNTTKSNTVLIEQNKILQNKFLSTERNDSKNNKMNGWCSINKESEKNLNINISKINNADSKKIKINKKQNLTDKFFVTNTEMSLYQIYEKLNKFCKENNLMFKNNGKNNFVISEKNFKNNFGIEIIESSPSNIVKFFHGKNTGIKIKEISTKLFIEIANS